MTGSFTVAVAAGLLAVFLDAGSERVGVQFGPFTILVIPVLIALLVIAPVLLATRRIRDGGLNVWLVVPVWWVCAVIVSKFTSEHTASGLILSLAALLWPALIPTRASDQRPSAPLKPTVRPNGAKRAGFGLRGA